MNRDQIEFIVRSFDPTHQIILDKHDCIVQISDSLIVKLLSLSMKQVETTELFEHTFYELLQQDLNNTFDFISSFRLNVHLLNAAFIAVNSDISISSRLAIPCIYLYMVMPSLNNNGEIVIKFYNLIEIIKKFQTLFVGSFISSTINLTNKLRNNFKQKSIYFAYESLKPLASFIPVEHINSSSNNGIFLADILKSFHATNFQRDDKLYRMKLFKHDGYIERNKNKFSMQISQQLQEKIKELPVIPFNALNHNMIVGL